MYNGLGIEKRYRRENGKKTKDRLYYVTWEDENGSRKGCCKKAGSNYGTAEDIVKAMKDEAIRMKEGLPLPPKKVTIKQAIDEFGDAFGKRVARDGASARTWDNYERALDLFVAFLKSSERFVGSVRSDEVLAFREELVANHNEGGMISVLSAVRTFFSYCKRKRYASENPATDSTEGLHGKKIEESFDDDQVRLFIDLCSRRRGQFGREFVDIIKVALMTGLRQEEITKFTIKPDGRIWVIGKGRKARYVPTEDLDKSLWSVLDKYRSRNPIFSGWDRGKVRSYWYRIANDAKKVMPLPTKHGFHVLRHTFADTWVRQGRDIRVLQRILGHSSLATTMRYLRANDKEAAAQMKQMKYGWLEPRLAVI